MPLVKYIGTVTKVDSVPGSQVSWEPGQIREVSLEMGGLLTAYTDSFIYFYPVLDSNSYQASGELNVADMAEHPGEDAVFDRTFGGALCVASGPKSVDSLINNGACILYGYIVHAATATAAITIENGITAGSGATVATLPPGKIAGEYIFPVGISCSNGLFLNYATGATGSVSVLYWPAV
ncbi:hypothetical protein [Nitrosospira sp. NpAV]|uniref:hypothetical protein n=1 Tax=Nitrosospira sp. NpAV TaxID=58133 RepID=UPI0012EC8234|nr:hypothetical protein [Nitrosospira sp. NpAV]